MLSRIGRSERQTQEAERRRIREAKRQKDAAIKIQANRKAEEARKAEEKLAYLKLGDNIKSMLKNNHKDIVENYTSQNPDRMVSTVLYMLKLAFENIEGSDKNDKFESNVEELLNQLDVYLKNKPKTKKREGGYKRKKGTKKKRSRKKRSRKKGTRKKRRK